ncbi:MAG: helix-turn-helix domain-containing protein [Sphaerochaetaceae bacterium]|nr:helix-turn-helix domain-containing protein [Sphaerochaetaceae bacterium]
MSVFDDIKQGLNQAIEYEKGSLKAKTTRLSISEPVTFKAKEIKKIRQDAGLTQKNFALFMGVSIKTVEAWESGRIVPSGPASRLLYFTRQDPTFPHKSGIII